MAQNLIFQEFKRIATIGVDHFAYGYTLRTTHGLTYACELARYSSIYGLVPLKSIHVHWKMLSISSTNNTSDSWGT